MLKGKGEHMSDGKRYYWLRLHDDFFNSKRIKKLRKMAGGDTYTIIYLKMQLLAMKTEGVLKWTGLEANIAEELALDLDEEADDIKVTLSYLISCELVETSDNVNFFIPYAIENTGSETASAQRVREYRDKQKVLQCNNNVITMKQNCNGEKEIDIEIEKDIEIDIEKSKEKVVIEKENNNNRFSKPSVDEINAYCSERVNGIDGQRFYDYYETKGWKIGKNPMKDWKAAVRTWERKSRNDISLDNLNIIAEILKYLNNKTNSNYTTRNDDGNVKMAELIKKGYSVEDFKKVIDLKCEEWSGTKFEPCLNPSTLFKPDNFEKYLNQKSYEKGGKFVSESDRKQANLYKSGFEWCE